MAAAPNELETLLGEKGLTPNLISELIAAGWTADSFRDIVASVSEFTDAVFIDLYPTTVLTLLQKSIFEVSLEGPYRNQFQAHLQPAQACHHREHFYLRRDYGLRHSLLSSIRLRYLNSNPSFWTITPVRFSLRTPSHHHACYL